MDIYDEIELKKKEKEVFESTYNKQLKYSKKALTITFLCCGVFFIMLGFLVYFIDKDDSALLPMCICGGVFFIVGIIFACIKKPLISYERYKKMINKTGTVDLYSLEARIQNLEEEVERLKKNIK